MKAILVIDVPNEHLWKTLNDIFERMKGYKCSIKPMPDRKDEGYPNDDYTIGKADGWNACIEEIEK